MSLPYRKFPGDVQIEKGFIYGLHFFSVIDKAGGRADMIDLKKMTANDLINHFATNDIYLIHMPPKQETEEKNDNTVVK